MVGWIEPGGLAGGPGASSSVFSVLSRTPALPRLGAGPCTAEAAAGGHLLLARGGWWWPRDRQVAEPEELVRLERGAQARAPWEITRVFPLPNAREEKGGTGGAATGPRPQAASQQGRDHDITPSRRGRDFTGHARQRGQTAQPEPRQPGQDRSRAAAPLYMWPGPWAPLSDTLLHGVHGHVVVVAAHGQVRLRGEGRVSGEW